MEKKYKILITVSAVVIVLSVALYAYYYLSHGTVKIDANLQKTTVTINGEEKGTAPLKVTLKPGHYEIVAQKKGFTNATQEVDLSGGSSATVFLELGLKVLSPQELAKMSTQELTEYQAAADFLNTQNEEKMVSLNPIVKYLPYNDPQGRFRADYNGEINNPTYKVTICGYSESEINSNKSIFLQWVRNKGGNPNTMNIQYTEELNSDV
jgi:hypothetical protein